MSLQSHLENDLTTDAVPSPPRDEVKEEVKIDNDQNEYSDKQPKTKTKSKVFRKAKKGSSPTAFASVININNANGIHVGSNYNVYLNKTENAQPKDQKDYTETESVKALFNSNQPVERKHLIFISPHINEHWRTTARLLDYSDGQISQFYEDYIKSGIKEVIYQLLLDWIQNEADDATIGRLTKVLWNTSQQDTVMRWSKNFSEEL